MHRSRMSAIIIDCSEETMAASVNFISKMQQIPINICVHLCAILLILSHELQVHIATRRP